MILVEKTVISDDIKDSFFVCHLEKCKGACCVEGDLGAPLEDEELAILDDIYEAVNPYISEEGRQVIDRQGKYVLDDENEFSTPTINGKECAYAVYDEKGILKCGIELAYKDKKTSFQKPISCHLYPIRVTRYDDYEAINYNRWYICNDACTLGEALNVPLYKFLKEPLIRKYGEEWYEELVKEIEGENQYKS